MPSSPPPPPTGYRCTFWTWNTIIINSRKNTRSSQRPSLTSYKRYSPKLVLFHYCFSAQHGRISSLLPKWSSETQGQSVGSGEKAGRKFSSTGERAPGYRLSSNYFQKFKRMPAPDWAQKTLCNIVPNRRTVSTEFFTWIRTRRLLSRHTCPVRSPSCACKGNFIFYFPNQKQGNYRWTNLPREYSVSDGPQCIVNNRKFKLVVRRRESQISIYAWQDKTTTLHVHRAFLYISLPSTARIPVKMPNFTFVEDVNKQWQSSFSSGTWIWLIEIQLQESLLAFDKVS